MKNKYQIVVVGGGNGGITVAAQLLRKDKNLDIAIIDPSAHHYYQPAWTMVGGIYDIDDTVKSEASVIPEGVTWIKEAVTGFAPDQNEVMLASGINVGYAYLVVAPGIQLNWNEVKGLAENIGKNGVCSNYSFATAPYTFECLKIRKAAGRYLQARIHP